MNDSAQISRAKGIVNESNLSKYSSLWRPLNQIDIAEAVAVGTLAANQATKENSR